jgi:hypothetical protein
MTERLDNEAAELSNACYALTFDSFIEKKYELNASTKERITRFRSSFHYTLQDAHTWIKNVDANSIEMNFIVIYEAQATGDYLFSPEESSRLRVMRTHLSDWFSMTELKALNILKAYL